MTLAMRGTPTTGSQASGTGFTVAAPSGLTATDKILIFSVALSGTIGAMTGFSDSGESVASSFHARAFARTADGTEGSTFSVTSAGTPGAAICVAYSGTFGTDPATLPASFVSSANATTVPVPGVTLTSTGDWLVWFGAAMRNANSTPGTIGAPSGFTPQANTGAIAGASESCYILLADLETPQSAGATGTQTGTSSLSVPRGGWLVGLAATAPPAPSGSGLLMALA